jgi:hypothetical protein
MFQLRLNDWSLNVQEDNANIAAALAGFIPTPSQLSISSRNPGVALPTNRTSRYHVWDVTDLKGHSKPGSIL